MKNSLTEIEKLIIYFIFKNNEKIARRKDIINFIISKDKTIKSDGSSVQRNFKKLIEKRIIEKKKFSDNKTYYVLTKKGSNIANNTNIDWSVAKAPIDENKYDTGNKNSNRLKNSNNEIIQKSEELGIDDFEFNNVEKKDMTSKEMNFISQKIIDFYEYHKNKDFDLRDICLSDIMKVVTSTKNGYKHTEIIELIISILNNEYEEIEKDEVIKFIQTIFESIIEQKDHIFFKKWFENLFEPITEMMDNWNVDVLLRKMIDDRIVDRLLISQSFPDNIKRPTNLLEWYLRFIKDNYAESKLFQFDIKLMELTEKWNKEYLKTKYIELMKDENINVKLKAQLKIIIKSKLSGI